MFQTPFQNVPATPALEDGSDVLNSIRQANTPSGSYPRLVSPRTHIHRDHAPTSLVRS